MTDQKIELYRELVMVDGAASCTTSRHVAAKFGKAHKTVLRNIDALRKAIKSGGTILRHEMFEESIRIDGRGKPQREFRMSQSGFALLAMRFTGPAALAWQLNFIAAFEWLSDQLREREENNRLMAQFDIKNRASIEDGSYHGRGLRKRQIEKPLLEAEENAIKEKLQMALPMTAANRLQ